MPRVEAAKRSLREALEYLDKARDALRRAGINPSDPLGAQTFKHIEDAHASIKEQLRRIENGHPHDAKAIESALDSLRQADVLTT
jgi:hypothetical protein